MTTMEQKNLSSSRIRGPTSANIDLLECCICQDILWKPIACQTCETPFCSACINKWLSKNPNKCPNQCQTYVERKCPPVIVKLLAQLQISCLYQEQGCQEIISYEALEKHEHECGYQFQTCSGCKVEILKKDYKEHENNCDLVELTCEDCKLKYKRNDITVIHTENSCLKEQVRQLQNESKNNKLEMQELLRQLRELRALNPIATKLILNFADLPSSSDHALAVPNKYKGLKWSKMAYMNKTFATSKYPKSGYATAFTTGGSPHVAFFKDEASIVVERPNETFTLISVNVCAAWKDDLQFTIKGHQKSVESNTHAVILSFGKPQLISLQWQNIDKLVFTSSGGTLHPGSHDTAGGQVIFNQILIGQPV